METTTFRIWESNKRLLDNIQNKLEKKRKQVLSKNLVINEALKLLDSREEKNG